MFGFLLGCQVGPGILAGCLAACHQYLILRVSHLLHYVFQYLTWQLPSHHMADVKVRRGKDREA